MAKQLFKKTEYLLKVVPSYNKTTSKKSLSGEKENTCMAISLCPDTSWCEKGPTLHLEEAEQIKNCCPYKMTAELFLDLLFGANKPQSFEARISPRWEEENI